MAPMLPRVVGGVRVGERIGEGGMAFVHRGEDPFRPELGFAVKFLRPDAALDAETVRRFLQEGEVLKRLRHPHLVEVYEFGRAGGTPFVLMELLPGGSIKDCRGEAPSVILRRIIPVTEALALAHAEGVIHRDLKPSNLLFAADGRLKVTDFGVCLWEGGEGTRLTRSRMVVGTVGYMAPEQHGDPRRVNARCDVYALGAILYEFTTGQSYSQIQLPPASVRPGFPPSLAGIIMRALSPDPVKRIASMSALGQELSMWLESAAAAGWGEERLPGFFLDDATQATVSRVRTDDEDADARLGPYLDALRSGGVGARRTAAERLVASVRPSDEDFLLEQLAISSDGARFALVQALGAIAGASAIDPLLQRLNDPFSRAEAAEAVSQIALRGGLKSIVLASLQEVGLGSTWRWMPRARLADETWVQALESSWSSLAAPLRIQALEAARLLPGELKVRVRQIAERSVQAGGRLRELWEEL